MVFLCTELSTGTVLARLQLFVLCTVIRKRHFEQCFGPFGFKPEPEESDFSPIRILNLKTIIRIHPYYLPLFDTASSYPHILMFRRSAAARFSL